MEKRISSRGIIINKNEVLTIFRRKVNTEGKVKQYYVIPGGGLEDNETLEENLLRELKEELGIEAKIKGFVGKRETDTTIEYYFSCSIVNGIPTLGGEEKERNNQNNYYEIRSIKLSDIDNIDLQGTELIKKAELNEFIDINEM